MLSPSRKPFRIFDTPRMRQLAIAEENYAYYRGEHWQFNILPKIDETDPEALRMMEASFLSSNLIRECCDRYINALIGQDFAWYLKPVEGSREDGAVDEAALAVEKDLQVWLDQVETRALQMPAEDGLPTSPWRRSLLDLIVTGTGGLFLWEPERYADSEDARDRLHLRPIVVGTVEVEYDDEDFIERFIFHYGASEEKKRYYDMDQDEVVITGYGVEDEMRIDTGGRWPVSLLQGEPLLTPQIKSLQNALNHGLSMMPNNQSLAGFRETFFLNALPPGEYKQQDDGLRSYVVDEEGFRTGPGTVNFIQGIDSRQNLDGSVQSANPSVYQSEPSSPDTFIKSVDFYRQLLYYQFSQGHLMDGNEAAMAAISRIQQRQDFELDLFTFKAKAESAIANIMAVALRYFGYEGWEPIVEMQVTTGRLTPDERRAVIEEYQQGLISKATAIALLGSVDDVDAELELIESEGEAASTRRSPAAVELSDPLTDPSLDGQ